MQLQTTDHHLLHRIAECHLQPSQTAAVEAVYHKLIANEVNDAVSLFELGLCAKQHADWQQASERFKQALTLKPTLYLQLMLNWSAFY